MAEQAPKGPGPAVAIPRRLQGARWTIVHCEGALESLEVALETVAANKRRSMINGLRNQIRRHADGHPMAPRTFEDEGPLPGRNGGTSSRSFKAYKRIPIRAYLWQSPGTRDTWFVSHYIAKRRDKLADADIARVGDNFRRIEFDGDQC